MNALEQAADLQERAVQILLAEREAIDARLQQLGHGEGQIKKRRGRPPNIPAMQEKAPES